VHRGHEPADQAELLVQDLRHRRHAVRGAGGVGDDVVPPRVVLRRRLLEEASAAGGVPVEERESFISQLTRFLVAKIAQQDIYQFENEIETLDWLISVFPNHYGYSNRRFPSLSPFQRQVLLQQLRWEIFGSLTQHYNFPRNLFVENLKNFHTMLSKINWAKEENVQVLELQNDLKEAMELIILLESNSKLSEQVF